MLMAALTAFLFLLAVAPGADAKGDDTKQSDTTVLAATTGCPAGFVEGRTGCQPENLTTKDDDVVYTQVFDSTGCLAKWVSASVPGKCEANFFTTDAGDDVYAFVHQCSIYFDCEDFILAAEAFGGHCSGHAGGVSCEVPGGGPDPRP